MSFLTKKIVSFEPEIFGMDLSDLSIKVFQLESNGKIEKARSFYSLDIPPGNIEDGKIINPEKVAEYMREAVKKAGPKKIKSRKAICSLPESKVFLRMIGIPEMDESEAAEAVKWEMEANIPMPIDQVYFDWQFLSSAEKGKQNILTVAVGKEIVDELLATLEKAGLEAYGLEVESVASARSLVDKKLDKEGACLIVDLGAQRTSFIMAVKGAPYYTSSIPFSSESINDAIQKALNLNPKEAEEAKVSQGIENSEGESPVFGAVKPLLENLVQEIEKTLDFFAVLSKEASAIERIILCGGGSSLKGLIPFLEKRLGKAVEIGNPWVNLSLGKNLPPLNKDIAARYSTAIGLAMRGIDYEI